MLTGHQVFATRLSIALPFQEAVRTFAVRALILIFRELLKSTGED